MKNNTKAKLDNVLLVMTVIAIAIGLGSELFVGGSIPDPVRIIANVLRGLGIYLSLRLLLRKSFSILSLDLSLIEDDEPKLKSALVSLGHLPLLTFILYFALTLVGVLSDAVVCRTWFGFGPIQATVFALIQLTAGAYASSFIFVLADNLVMQHLLAQKVTRYPPSIRESRQKRKTIIIPLFMSIMAFLVNASTIMAVGMLAGDAFTSELSTRIAYVLVPVFILFHVMVAALVMVWARNNTFLFSTITKRLELIASSEKDLTGRIPILSIDEIATIKGLINTFSAMLTKNFTELKTSFVSLDAIQTQLFESIRGSTANTQSIMGSIKDVRSLVEREGDSVSEALKAGGQLTDDVKLMISQINEQNVNIKNTVMSTEMGLGAVSGSSDRASEVRQKVEELKRSFETSGASVNQSLSAVRNITERSKKLSEINSTIAKIASQTNLLAMNAAIEAAHAGDAGRGFSVVADEIRALAENTAQRTRDSRESLGAIIKDIQQALQVSTETEAGYRAMRDILTDVDAKTMDIANNLSKQDAMNQAILESLRESISQTERTSNTANDLITGTTALIDTLQTLEKDAKNTSLHSLSMTESGALLNASIEKLDELSHKGAELQKKTNSLVSEFKV